MRCHETIFKTPSRFLCVILYLSVCLVLLSYKGEIIEKSAAFWFDVILFSFVVPCVKMAWRGVVGHRLFRGMSGMNKLLAGLSFIVSLVLLSESSTYVSEKIMETVGIRKSGAVVQFDDGYHGFIGMAFMDKSALPAEGGGGGSISAPGLCAKDRQEFYFPDKPRPIEVDVLFSGIGAYHLIKMQGCRFLVPNERMMMAHKVVG